MLFQRGEQAFGHKIDSLLQSLFSHHTKRKALICIG